MRISMAMLNVLAGLLGHHSAADMQVYMTLNHFCIVLLLQITARVSPFKTVVLPLCRVTPTL